MTAAVPASHVFEAPELVTGMLADMATAPGALPLLQFAAAKMWEARDRSRRMLTTASYVAMGGIAGALAVHADAVLAEMPPARRQLAQRCSSAWSPPTARAPSSISTS